MQYQGEAHGSQMASLATVKGPEIIFGVISMFKIWSKPYPSFKMQSKPQIYDLNLQILCAIKFKTGS